MDLEVGGPASGLEATNKQHSILLRQGFGGQAKRIALDNSSILFNRPSFMNGCGNRVLNYPLFYPLLGVIPFLRQGGPGAAAQTLRGHPPNSRIQGANQDPITILIDTSAADLRKRRWRCWSTSRSDNILQNGIRLSSPDNGQSIWLRRYTR